MEPVKPLILAVDNEAQILELMKRTLEPAGYEVITAASGSQALELVAKRNPDLVLLDIRMPGKSGLGVLEELRKTNPDTAVIMATVVDDINVVVDAMKEGASDYLGKPFNMKEVLMSVERALERRRLILENRDYRLNLEKKVAEQTQLLELKVRELTGLNNLFINFINENLEMAENVARLAGDITKMAEGIQALAEKSQAMKVEANRRQLKDGKVPPQEPRG